MRSDESTTALIWIGGGAFLLTIALPLVRRGLWWVVIPISIVGLTMAARGAWMLWTDRAGWD